MTEGTPITVYQYPDDNDPIVKQVKRLAFRAGKSFNKDRDKYLKARTALKQYMGRLNFQELVDWQSCLMLDRRYNPATGQGGYIAVATRIVNETAYDLIKGV